VDVLAQRHDLEDVRTLLGHVRIDTTQIYKRIRPHQLGRTVASYAEPPGACSAPDARLEAWCQARTGGGRKPVADGIQMLL
jgi:hypothetical protein